MSKRLISDRELFHAAEKVSESMLSSLPPPSACDHEFSEQFEITMDCILDTARRIERQILFMRRVAAALLALLIGASAFLTLNSTTRAVISRWLHEVYENQSIYHFRGEDSDSPLPDCEIGWLPEGYMAENNYHDEMLYCAFYRDENHKLLQIEYYYMQEGTVTVYDYGDDVPYQKQSVTVHGMTAEFYECLDGSESNDLIWVDDEMDIFYSISGYLSLEDMIKIAESISLK